MRILTVRVEGRGEIDLTCTPLLHARTHRVHVGDAATHVKLVAFVRSQLFDLIGDDGIELRGCVLTRELPCVGPPSLS